MAKRAAKQQKRRQFEEEKRQQEKAKQMKFQLRLFTTLLLVIAGLLSTCVTFFPDWFIGKDTHGIRLLFLLTALAFANGLGWLLPILKYRWLVQVGKMQVHVIRLMAIGVSSVAWILMYLQYFTIPVHIIGLAGLLYLCLTGLDIEAVDRQKETSKVI